MRFNGQKLSGGATLLADRLAFSICHFICTHRPQRFTNRAVGASEGHRKCLKSRPSSRASRNERKTKAKSYEGMPRYWRSTTISLGTAFAGNLIRQNATSSFLNTTFGMRFDVLHGSINAVSTQAISTEPKRQARAQRTRCTHRCRHGCKIA